MSSSRRNGEAGDEAQELLLQERLQILLERLRWSYAALWTLNPHKRVLQWKRGYYSSQVMDTSKTAEKPEPGWYAQQFYATYRSCSFSLGTGFVGRANLEGRHIWLSGDSVCQNAGSLEQSQFLSYAKVKTVMCIPWLDSVLELGTTNYVGENFVLMDQIQQVLSHDLLSVPSLHDEDVAASLQQHQQQQSQSTVEPVLELPEAALNQPGGSSSFQSPFDTNMSNQVWRSDMLNFMQSEPDSSSTLPGELAAAWRVIENNNQHKSSIIMKASTSHGLMNLSQAGADQYVRSRTSSYVAGTSTLNAAATASSSTSVSSYGDRYSNSSSATRPGTSVSPELLHRHNIMQALSPDPNVSVSISPPDRISSTVREVHNLETYDSNIKHEQDPMITGARMSQSNIRRTTSCSDQYQIQRALSLFDIHDQWRHQHGLNPVADPCAMDTVTSDIWKQYEGMENSTSTLLNQNDFRKVQLQRRHTLAATEVLKELETYQQEAGNSYMVDSSGFFPVQAEVGPAEAQMNISTVANLRRHPRAASSSRGSEAADGHDKAAMSHMMAERRRRVKQKENFAILRRLVPIISKADKASTLVDAIVYLKDLQNTISEMKANEDEMVQRCEDLESKCSKLEEQNRELVAILTKDKPPGAVDHLINQLRLHSMKSI